MVLLKASWVYRWSKRLRKFTAMYSALAANQLRRSTCREVIGKTKLQSGGQGKVAQSCVQGLWRNLIVEFCRVSGSVFAGVDIWGPEHSYCLRSRFDARVLPGGLANQLTASYK